VRERKKKRERERNGRGGVRTKMGEIVGGCMSGGGEVKRKEGGTWVVGKKGKKKEKKKKKREGENIQREQRETEEENGKRRYFGSFEKNK
jgi:hypothetical protein